MSKSCDFCSETKDIKLVDCELCCNDYNVCRLCSVYFKCPCDLTSSDSDDDTSNDYEHSCDCSDD